GPALRDGQTLTRGNGDQFRITAAGDQRTDGIAGFPAGDAFSARDNGPGHLQTGDLGAVVAIRSALTRIDIAAVKPGSFYLDQNLSWCGNGIGRVAQLQHVWPSFAGDPYGFHRAKVGNAESGPR